MKSNNWGAQLNFMVPLDWGTVNRCKNIAKRQEEKLRLDYELVRALKCAELQQKGFTFRPGSRVEHMCNDVVPISQLTKTNTMSTLSDQRAVREAEAKAKKETKKETKKDTK